MLYYNTGNYLGPQVWGLLAHVEGVQGLGFRVVSGITVEDSGLRL